MDICGIGYLLIIQPHTQLSGLHFYMLQDSWSIYLGNTTENKKESYQELRKFIFTLMSINFFLHLLSTLGMKNMFQTSSGYLGCCVEKDHKTWPLQERVMWLMKTVREQIRMVVAPPLPVYIVRQSINSGGNVDASEVKGPWFLSQKQAVIPQNSLPLPWLYTMSPHLPSSS